jgi:hypothetical protein
VPTDVGPKLLWRHSDAPVRAVGRSRFFNRRRHDGFNVRFEEPPMVSTLRQRNRPRRLES